MDLARGVTVPEVTALAMRESHLDNSVLTLEGRGEVESPLRKACQLSSG